MASLKVNSKAEWKGDEGQLEGKQETARNMLNSGISRNMLQELTSIAEEELNMLKY